MKYRIEYTNGKYCKIVDSRNDLIKELETSNDLILDIRKIYKSGIADSVFETYKKYLEH